MGLSLGEEEKVGGCKGGGGSFGRQFAIQKLWFCVGMWTRKLAFICLINSVSSEGGRG